MPPTTCFSCHKPFDAEFVDRFGKRHIHMICDACRATPRPTSWLKIKPPKALDSPTRQS